MTLDYIASFGVDDISAISVSCSHCKTVVSIKSYEYAKGTVYCPVCSTRGDDGILWTEKDGQRSPLKAITVAILQAKEDERAKHVRLSA